MLVLQELSEHFLVLEGRIASSFILLLLKTSNLSYLVYFLDYISEILLFAIVINSFPLHASIDYPSVLLLCLSFGHVNVGTVQVVLGNLAVIV